MNYLIGYLAIGALVTLAFFVWDRMSKASLFERESDLTDAMYPERKTLRYRMLDRVVTPVLVVVVTIAIWPVAIYLQVKMVLAARARAPASKVFAVTKDDLLQQLTVQEIEAREYVTDPLGAVPDLPFGHLNAAWCRFTSQLEPTDLIWSFAARWESGWGGREQRAGYVAWRDGTVKPYFLMTRRMER